MKLGIIGLPRSGKSTIFEALTQNILPEDHKREHRIGTVRVPDKRVDVLSQMFQPKKTVYAQVEYFLPARLVQKQEEHMWAQVRDCDAFIHVVRNFGGYGFEDPTPYDDFHTLDHELIFADIAVAEKRIERMELDKNRGKTVDETERSLLEQCLGHLENETPLRQRPDIVSAHQLKGFAFLSAKSMLILFNNEDEDDGLPAVKDLMEKENCSVIRGKLEQELAQMSDEEAKEFLDEFSITASAMDRVIKQTYELLGLISFFTFVENEVKSWKVKKDTDAVDAAGVIHSDMKKGFIRAEVVSYESLISAGSYHQARQNGDVRLEGKTYKVQDGDVITFRFNV
jgi:ribosome-binding ATPase